MQVDFDDGLNEPTVKWMPHHSCVIHKFIVWQKIEADELTGDRVTQLCRYLSLVDYGRHVQHKIESQVRRKIE